MLRAICKVRFEKGYIMRVPAKFYAQARAIASW
jgi:hypothetical protein